MPRWILMFLDDRDHFGESVARTMWRLAAYGVIIGLLVGLLVNWVFW